MDEQLWQVVVDEQRNATLAGTDGLAYASPPHQLQQARLLIGLLNGCLDDGPGPWRHPVAGGTRTIHLQPLSPP